MRVGQIMRPDVVTVSPDMSVLDAIDIMLERDVSELVAVDQDRRVVGVVTEADIIARSGFHPPADETGPVATRVATWHNRWRVKAAATTVGELMSSPAMTTTADAAVASCAARMVTHAFKRLPVVDDEGRLVGMVSQRDVLRTVARGHAGHGQPAGV